MKIQLNNNVLPGIEVATIPTPKISTGKISRLLSALPLGLGSKKKIIAILPLNGIIAKGSSIKTTLNLECLNSLIEKAFEKIKPEALCLTINSPGGSPVQSELIASKIRLLCERNKVPVYAFVEDVAASGGYWLACAADEIYASRSSIIGSIGVISSGFGFHEALEKLGIERRIYTEGKNKSILDPFLPEKPNDVKIIKKLQKELHEYFISYVKNRRRGMLTQSDDILFNGEFWSGSTALDYGLIDGIEDLYRFIDKKFGKDVKIEYLTTKKSWIKNKLGMSLRDFAAEFSQCLVDAIENKIKTSKFTLF